MNGELLVGVTLKADGSGLVGEVGRSQAAIRGIGQAANDASAQAVAASNRMGGAIGMNRIGLMELRAAGVNTFQALAAGMNPVTVAMMEGAQVIGALAQGGVLTLGVLAQFAVPLAAIAAGVGLLAVKFFDDEAATKAADDAMKDFKDALDKTAPVLDTVAQAEERLARSKIHEAIAAQSKVILDADKAIIDAQSGHSTMLGGLFNALPGAGQSLEALKQQLDALQRTQGVGRAAAQQDAVQLQQRITLTEAIISANQGRIDSANKLLDALSKQLAAGKTVSDQEKEQTQRTRELDQADRQAAQAFDDWNRRQLEAEHTRVQTIADMQTEVDQLSRLLDAHHRSAIAVKDMQAEIDAENIARQKGIDLQSQEGQTLLGLVVTRNALKDAIDKTTKASKDEATTLSQGVTKGFNDVQKSAQDMGKLSERAVTDSFSSMEDALVKFTTTGKLDFSSFADSVIADLARIAIRQQITGPLYGALSGLFNASATPVSAATTNTADLEASVHHAGGMVGGPAPHRSLPPWMFAGAPRLHSGGLLLPGEVPIVARVGERVLTPEQQAAMGQGAPVSITIVNTTGQPAKTQQTRNANGGRDVRVMIGEAVASDLQTGGPASRAFETRYGIHPATDGR